MNFDIAIGTCIEIGDTSATVRLDNAMLRRLCPTLKVGVPPKARLRVPLAICSSRRPPRDGQELFLDYEQTLQAADAWLDSGGDGEFVAIDARVLASDIDPSTQPEPSRKPGRSFYY